MNSLKLMLITFVVLIVVLVNGQTFAEENVGSYPRNKLSTVQWQQDADFLVAKIETMHPNPWRTISKQGFQQHLAGIVKSSQRESKSQTICALIRTVAMITDAGQDGHSGLWPIQKATGFHLLPLRLYWFEDGIYILDTNPSNKHLIGQKLIAIENIPMATVIDKVKPYVSNENDMWKKSWAPLYALIPELLQSIGIASDNKISITVQSKDGSKSNHLLTAIDGKLYDQNFPAALNVAILPVSKSSPLYLRNVFDQRFWFRQIGDHTLYFQYNLVLKEDNDGETFADFISKMTATIQQHGLRNIIVDIRNNGGGDNTTYGSFFDMLNQFNKDEHTLNLYALIGRVTFSAAINFTADLKANTNAIFIGEATGGSPDQYGDPEYIKLPSSKLSVRISTRYWNKTGNEMGDKDSPLTHEPDLPVLLTSEQYFSNKDPALEKVLEMIKD